MSYLQFLDSAAGENKMNMCMNLHLKSTLKIIVCSCQELDEMIDRNVIGLCAYYEARASSLTGLDRHRRSSVINALYIWLDKCLKQSSESLC